MKGFSSLFCQKYIRRGTEQESWREFISLFALPVNAILEMGPNGVIGTIFAQTMPSRRSTILKSINISNKHVEANHPRTSSVLHATSFRSLQEAMSLNFRSDWKFIQFRLDWNSFFCIFIWLGYYGLLMEYYYPLSTPGTSLLPVLIHATSYPTWTHFRSMAICLPDFVDLLGLHWFNLSFWFLFFFCSWVG